MEGRTSVALLLYIFSIAAVQFSHADISCPRGIGASIASVAAPSIQICNDVSSWTSDNFKSSSTGLTSEIAPSERYRRIKRNLAYAQEGLFDRIYSRARIARSDAVGVWVERISWTVARPISSAGCISVWGRFFPAASALP